MSWRQSNRSEDNIKIDLREITFKGVVWIQVAQDKSNCEIFENMVMWPRVQYNKEFFENF
jgi:hypothetical protein